jgi:RHS repeat-associated protein
MIAYDGWKPILEWDVWDGQVYFKAWNVYGAGPDEILYRHDATRGDLRYHLDRMGNVAFLLDADGDGIERYTYDAFGQPTVTDWNGENPRTWSVYGNRFMFTGREYFPELGIYDYRNRFYHPIIGRFLQSDPIGFGGGDANLFRYCGGDPVNRSDAFGLYDGYVPIKPLEPFGTNTVLRNDDFDDPITGSSGSGSGSRSGSGAPGGLGALGAAGVNFGAGDRGSSSGPSIGGNGLFGSVDSHSRDGGGGGGGTTKGSQNAVTTYFSGQTYNLFVGVGLTVSIGSYHTTTGQFGTYLTYGHGIGADFGMSVTAGTINGGSEVFAGEYKNTNFGAFVLTGSGHFGPSTNYLGSSYGVQTPGFGFSRTDTNTILFPDVSFVGEYRRPDGSIGWRDGPRF